MQYEFEKKIGKTTFTFKSQVDSHAAFFREASFFSDLPEVGPNGENDVRIVHRSVRGMEFFSLISDKAAMEFKLGTYKDVEGKLFSKGEWTPVYQANGGGSGGSAKTTTPAPAQTQPSSTPPAATASADQKSVTEEYL